MNKKVIKELETPTITPTTIDLFLVYFDNSILILYIYISENYN